jgi:hypothetical protein
MDFQVNTVKSLDISVPIHSAHVHITDNCSCYDLPLKIFLRTHLFIPKLIGAVPFELIRSDIRTLQFARYTVHFRLKKTQTGMNAINALFLFYLFSARDRLRQYNRPASERSYPNNAA